MAGMMSGGMNAMQQPIQQPQMQPPPQITPPPMPGNVNYMLAVNGEQYGSYNMQQLQQMVASGQMKAQTLVWSQGMAAWEPAVNRADLASLFTSVPPTPPTI